MQEEGGGDQITVLFICLNLYNLVLFSISLVEHFIKDVSMFLSAGEISILARNPSSPLHSKLVLNSPAFI